MTERIKTLVLDANGFGWKPILADTVLQGVLGIREDTVLPKWVKKIPLLDHALNNHYEKLSYVFDWREELEHSPALDVTVCNINNLLAYRELQQSLTEYPLVIVLHSAAGDSMSLLLKASRWFHKRRGKIVMFIGNEYDLLDEKIRFIQETGVEYVCSQLPEKAARWLYSECTRSKILAMPHALNSRLYHAGDVRNRPVELGFRGARYPLFIGDQERNNLLDFFRENAPALGLKLDFGFKNIRRGEWADFLRKSQAVVGAEAGTYYLDRHGQAINAARQYQRQNPGADLQAIYDRFFKNLADYISGKSISSRHFEPVGTKTCQVLLEGDYNGILKPEEHYIEIKKDLSNIEDAVRRLKDESYRVEMVNRAYDYVLANHTYAHRVRELVSVLEKDGL